MIEEKTRHAEALFAEGKIKEAKGLLLGLLESDPSSTEALNNLGVISHAQGNTRAAEHYFSRALALKDDDLDAALNLADLYQESHRWTGAAACLERCLDRMSSDFNFLNQLGRVYLESGHAGKALGVLSTSLRLNPDQQEVRDSVAALQPGTATAQNVPDREIMRILFVQEAPCIRNYKMARALMSRGHRVSLAYTKATLNQMYKGLSDTIYNDCIRIDSNRRLWELSSSYDIVHCHNEPDVLTVAALAGDTPVVHDTHDLISLRANGDQNLSYLEGIANRGAAGRVYTTPYQRQIAERLYGCEGPSLVFYNYASEPDLPGARLPKLSDQDGQTHIVYEGGVGGNTHRDFKALFFDLASQGIHIHIYPSFYDQALARLFSQHQTIHYYEPLTPKDLMGAMTQYDYGIIPFNLEKGNKQFLDSTIANKLFEYVAAGLPVLASSLRSYEEYFARHPLGMTFRTVNDILEGLPRLRQRALKPKTPFQVQTYEGEIHKLVEFYREVIRSEKEPPPQKESSQRRSPASPAPETKRADSPVDPSQLQEKVAAAVLDLDKWLGRYGWAGFDPYDIKSYLLKERVAGKISAQQADEIMAREKQDPGALRRELGIAPRVNAKAMGLFLGSYLELTSAWSAGRCEDKISACLQWLLGNRASGMEGYGWGYPFDWESVIIIPEGTPTAVISYHVGDAFWKLYEIEKDHQWLELCLKIADFFTQDLNRDEIDGERICFSYTPLDFYHIHNANLSVAEFLLRIGKETGRSRLTNLGERALAFTLSDFAPEGYLTYWARGHEPSEANVGQIDHYHTAAELRALYRLSNLLPERAEIKDRFERYFEYYLAHFFHQNTIPKIHPKSLYPINIHAAAEAAYILGETAAAYPQAMETASRFLPWFLDTFRNPDGSFAYLIERHPDGEHKNRFPFLRWGQAWTMRGLVSSLSALRHVDAPAKSGSTHGTITKADEAARSSSSSNSMCCRASYLSHEYKDFLRSMERKISVWGETKATSLETLFSIVTDYPDFFPFDRVKAAALNEENIKLIGELVKAYYQAGKLDFCLTLTEAFKDRLLCSGEFVRIYLNASNFRHANKDDLLSILATYEHLLDDRDTQEFQSCFSQKISPTLKNQLGILQCLRCGSNALTIEQDGDVLRCNRCRSTYPVVEGVPILLEKDLDEFLTIEPEYQDSYRTAMIASVPGFERMPRYVNKLCTQNGRIGTNTFALALKYCSLVVWNHLSSFFEQFSQNRPLRILEIGSGLGGNMYALSDVYPHYDFFGVDIVLPGSQKSQGSRGNKRNQYFCCDAAKLPFMNETFDAVISIYSIEHAGKEMMAEAKRVLIPNGKMFVAGPSEKSYAYLDTESLNNHLASLGSNLSFKTHGLSKKEYLELFADFSLDEHFTNNYTFRSLLENEAIDHIDLESAETLFETVSNVVGPELDKHDITRWFNYIQIFSLSKAA